MGEQRGNAKSKKAYFHELFVGGELHLLLVRCSRVKWRSHLKILTSSTIRYGTSPDRKKTRLCAVKDHDITCHLVSWEPNGIWRG